LSRLRRKKTNCLEKKTKLLKKKILMVNSQDWAEKRSIDVGVRVGNTGLRRESWDYKDCCQDSRSLCSRKSWCRKYPPCPGAANYCLCRTTPLLRTICFGLFFLVTVRVLFLLVSPSFLLRKPQRQKEGGKEERKREKGWKSERENERERTHDNGKR